MTDIGGGIFSLVVTAIFLQILEAAPGMALRPARFTGTRTDRSQPTDPHAAEAAALVGPPPPTSGPEKPLTVGSIALAWMPFALMSVLLLLTGLVRQEEGRQRQASRR